MKRSAQRTYIFAHSTFLASASSVMMMFCGAVAHAESSHSNAPVLTPPSGVPTDPSQAGYAERRQPVNAPRTYTSSAPRQKPLAPVRILLNDEPATHYTVAAPMPVEIIPPAPAQVAAPFEPPAPVQVAVPLEPTAPQAAQIAMPAPPVAPQPVIINAQAVPTPVAPSEPDALTPLAWSSATHTAPLAELSPAAGPAPEMISIRKPIELQASPPRVTSVTLDSQPVIVPTAPMIAGTDEAPTLRSAPVSPVTEQPIAEQLPTAVAETIAAPQSPVPLPDTIDPVKDSLSEETKAILNHLPADLAEIKKARSAKTEKFSVDRINPAIDVFGDAGYDSTEAVGVKIEVRKPSPNLNHELENAYEALISGHSEDAITLYQNALDQDPDNTLGLFGLATTYHRLGLLDKARPVYGRLLRIDPNHKEGLSNFLALVADESPKAALEELEKLELKNPGFSPIPAQIGLIYKKLGDLPNAVKKMSEAARISPENMAYRYNLAVTLDKMGNSADAAQLYSQILSANDRGEAIPGDPVQIQERLTFIRSN